jgi:hypothetical protein
MTTAQAVAAGLPNVEESVGLGFVRHELDENRFRVLPYPIQSTANKAEMATPRKPSDQF